MVNERAWRALGGISGNRPKDFSRRLYAFTVVWVPLIPLQTAFMMAYFALKGGYGKLGNHHSRED